MGQRDPAFRHHLDQIARAELIGEIPAEAKDDDFPVEVPTLE
jgi:hypothetical protein